MAKTMIKRPRRVGRAQAPARAAADGFSLSAEIPGVGVKPLWSLKLELAARSQGEGEHLRLRMHLQANIASTQAALADARGAGAASGKTGSGLPVPRAAQWLLRALERPALRRIAGPLLRHDVNSWLELRASTADLAGGAGALLPEAERLKSLGIDTGGESGPLARTWAGSAGGANPGFAQVSLLQLDKRHLPPRLAVLLGSAPLQLAAALVNVIDERPVRR
jgi:hypothetical protein